MRAGFRWFVAYRFLGACLPYLPVASLCLAARGLSWAEVLQLGALYAVASAALVIPVSALAARVGTRRTLIGGALAVAIGAALAATSDGVATMAIAQIAFAIAAAVDAGADSAYLWSLYADDRAGYRRAEARSTAGKLAGGVVGMALGGALLAWSPSAPFAAATLFAVAAAACAARLPGVAPEARRDTVIRTLPDAATALVHAAGGWRWLVVGVVSCAVARVLASAIGPLLADAGFATTTATAVATVAAVVAAAAAIAAGTLAGRLRRLALFVAAPVALAAVAIALASAHGATAAALVAVLPMIAAVLGPLWRAHLNQHMPATAPRLLVLAVDATLVRIAAGALPLSIASAAPRAGVATLGVALIAVLALVAIAVAVRHRRARVVALALAIAAVPSLAAADDWRDEAPAVCTDAIAIDKPLGQGTTIKFKAHVGDRKVVVRPAQTSAAGNFRADVAAYRLSAALGLDTVPYACIRRVDRAALEAIAGPELRARLATEVAWAADGTVAASVVVWVDGVKPAELEKRRAAWRAQLVQVTTPSADRDLVAAAAEGSRLAVWDFLIANWDRWSGGNTFRLGAAGPFVWLDNAAGFGRELARTRTQRARQLDGVQRLSRSMVEALRELDDDTLAVALDGVGLSAARTGELRARRDLLLAHVDRLIEAHGEDAVLVYD